MARRGNAALLSVRVRDAWGRFTTDRAGRVARNRAFVFVDFPKAAGEEPVPRRAVFPRDFAELAELPGRVAAPSSRAGGERDYARGS
jgi:hypothetical protein